MNTCDRIRNLRISKSMTQRELSVLTGSSIITVQCWERGSKNPSMSAIIALAKALNVSTDYLLGVEHRDSYDPDLVMSGDERSLINDYRRLDYYGKQLVGTVCRLEKDRADNMLCLEKREKKYIPRYVTPAAAGMSSPVEGEDYEMIPVGEHDSVRADFAVKIQGDSMLPYIHDGDTVLVQRTSDLRRGEIGIFCVNGAMYCKIFYRDNDGNISLLSANPDYRNTDVMIDRNCDYEFIAYGRVLIDTPFKTPLCL